MFRVLEKKLILQKFLIVVYILIISPGKNFSHQNLFLSMPTVHAQGPLVLNCLLILKQMAKKQIITIQVPNVVEI